MNSIEHSFPLPEVESHKLDAIKEELTSFSPRHQTVGSTGMITTYILGIVSIMGLLSWFWYTSSRR